MIGHRLQALLQEHGKSVIQLAEHCEVSAQSVYNWLHGTSAPLGKRKDAIASFFGVSLQELDYGPVLSLVPIPSKPHASAAKLNPKIAQHTTDLIMSAELNKHPPKSVEYMEGMRNRLFLMYAGVASKSKYSPGTCQSDAYDAGYLHGTHLIFELQLAEK